MTKILGVLLAGGLSRRMGGGDKGLIPLAGKPVMSHALDRLQSMSDQVVINANGDPNRFAQFEATIIPDQISGFAGPLAGVHAALCHAQAMDERPDFVLSAAADTPFFPNDLLDKMLEKAKTPETIVLAESGGRRHPVFGLWPTQYADDLGEWLSDPENRKVLAWVHRHPWATANFDDSPLKSSTIDPFFNINTPEDLTEAEKHLDLLNA